MPSQRSVKRALEAPTLLLLTSSLREPQGAGGGGFFVLQKNTSPTKNIHPSRHPELDSGSVKVQPQWLQTLNQVQGDGFFVLAKKHLLLILLYDSIVSL